MLENDISNKGVGVCTKQVISIFVILLCSTFYVGQSEAAPITGTISLPSGQVAPEGGLQIFFSARDINGIESPHSTYGMIAPGESSRTYTLENVPDNNATDWRITYTCSFTDGCLEYVSNGYFNSGVSGNATYKEGEATTIKQGAAVNMTILEGTKLSGTMSMPFGVAPAGGADFQIFVRSSDSSLSFNHEFTFPEGSNSHPFGITVPNDSSLDYKINYGCLGARYSYCNNNFLTYGYYNSSAPNNMLPNLSDAELLPGNISRNDLNMELLGGTTISGTVFLPHGTAPAGGIPIRVNANDTQNGNVGRTKVFTMAENTNSVDYSLNIVEDTLSAWRVWASCDAITYTTLCDNLGYFFSYYDADAINTTTDSYSEADSLTGGRDHDNINITILSGLTISGILTIEDGFFAPPGGLTVSVSAQDSAGGGVAIFEYVFIAEGLSSADFSIAVPNTDTDWWLTYFCSPSIPGCEEFAIAGYYDSDAPGMTTFVQREAEVLPGGLNHTGKILTVFSDPSNHDDEENFYVVPLSNGRTVIFAL